MEQQFLLFLFFCWARRVVDGETEIAAKCGGPWNRIEGGCDALDRHLLVRFVLVLWPRRPPAKIPQVLGENPSKTKVPFSISTMEHLFPSSWIRIRVLHRFLFVTSAARGSIDCHQWTLGTCANMLDQVARM